MFTRLGNLVVRRPRTLLIASIVALAIAAVLGGGVFDRLKGGGFDDPGSESTRAEQILEDRFDTGEPNVVLLVTAPAGASVDDPDVVAAGLALTERVAASPVVDRDDVASYWSLGSAPPLRSDDATKALVLARIAGDEDQIEEGVTELSETLVGTTGDGLTVEIGGQAEVFHQIGTTIEGDLKRAESIAIPATLALLLVVFGSVVAALLPLAVGIIAIFGAFGVLWVLTGMADVSIFSINLVTALGLGLAIDYSLFIVSRFREELAAGRTPDGAIRRTIETAGRTVAFSALTVAVSLSALLIFPLYFLRSFAYAGIGVILVAMAASLFTLPAILLLLGHRVDKGRLFGRHRTPTPIEEGLWHRIAMAVMRRPAVVALSATALLLIAGLPFLGVSFGVPDDRVLPEDNAARQVSEVLRSEFGSDESNAFPVILEAGSTSVTPETVADFATTVSTLDGVARVDAPGGRYVDGTLVAPADPRLEAQLGVDTAWVNVVPSVEPISAEGEQLVDDVRTLSTPLTTSVGGASAGLVDSKSAIFSLVPWAGLAIAVATFVLLFLMFGSVLVPIKAIVLNTLSLTATFGLMVWVFQDGNGAGLLGFTATGLTDITTPILMFCIAFGLSMDYEVFLLSRMKEEYDRTGDNNAAIASGLEHTGRIVTAAALLLSITFFAFATSGVTFIKLFGLGLGIAVLVDATIVRATLVPALMTMAGKANWWAPGWMRSIHARFGLHESAPDELPADLERLAS